MSELTFVSGATPNLICRIAPYFPNMSYNSSLVILKGKFFTKRIRLTSGGKRVFARLVVISRSCNEDEFLFVAFFFPFLVNFPGETGFTKEMAFRSFRLCSRKINSFNNLRGNSFWNGPVKKTQLQFQNITFQSLSTKSFATAIPSPPIELKTTADSPRDYVTTDEIFKNKKVSDSVGLKLELMNFRLY